MDKDILICLQALEWIRLDPHLPSDVCERLAEDDCGMPMLEGRIVPDDATYQSLLEIARIHCPEIVKHIEKERQKYVVEGGRADDPQEIEQKMDELAREYHDTPTRKSQKRFAD
jgi:hypothetical protein